MPDQQSLAERIAAMIEAEKAEKAPHPEPPRPIAYTYKTASHATGLGISTLQREVRAGRLRTTRIRGRVLFTDEELRRFLTEQAED